MQSERITVEQYRSLRERAERSRASRMALARRIGAECGVGSEAPFHMAHNAWVGRESGRPWRGVDYSGVRQLRRLERDVWAAARIVDRLIARRGLGF